MEMCQNLRIHLNTSAETSKSRLDALALFLGLYYSIGDCLCLSGVQGQQVIIPK